MRGGQRPLLENQEQAVSKGWKNGEQTVSGGLKCSVKIVIGDWEKGGLYYVVTEQLARISLVIIQKIENVHNVCVDMTKRNIQTKH